MCTVGARSNLRHFISVVKHPFLLQCTGFHSFHRCMTVVEEGLPVLHLLSPWLVRGETLLCCCAGTGSVASPQHLEVSFSLLISNTDAKCKTCHLEQVFTLNISTGQVHSLMPVCKNNSTRSNLRSL